MEAIALQQPNSLEKLTHNISRNFEQFQQDLDLLKQFLTAEGDKDKDKCKSDNGDSNPGGGRGSQPSKPADTPQGGNFPPTRR